MEDRARQKRLELHVHSSVQHLAYGPSQFRSRGCFQNVTWRRSASERFPNKLGCECMLTRITFASRRDLAQFPRGFEPAQLRHGMSINAKSELSWTETVAISRTSCPLLTTAATWRSSSAQPCQALRHQQAIVRDDDSVEAAFTPRRAHRAILVEGSMLMPQ